jgi:undecaprenyl-diphosphatase
LFIDRFFTKSNVHQEEGISYKKAFIIGCYQVLSIIFPGLSRSAATIIGGMSQKLDRKTAAEFSFFLAVPTMLAASVKSFYDVYKNNPEVLAKDNMTTLLIGSLVAFIVALLAVRFFIEYLQKHGFRLFGYYRIIVGVLVLVLIYLGVIH